MSTSTVRSGTREHPPLVVVSNRQPYQHTYTRDGSILWSPTTGGVAVALDAFMRERGGVWIAHGSGDADREVVDDGDKVTVPPDSPGYTLRRLWLTEQEARQYYEGFANEGLWPLCHEAHVRPVFRNPDWESYQRVNARFAEVIESELPDLSAPVFIQDYHLALVGASLRRRRPGVKSAIFWHIPWPSPDRLRICPWRRDLLTGLLGNDLIAFQLDRDRRNFLTAAREDLGLEGDAQHGTHRQPDRGGQGGPHRRRLRPDPAHRRRPDPGGGDGAAAAGAGARHAAHRHRRRPARLHQGRSRAAGCPRAAPRTPPRPARPADVRADRGPVAVEPAELRRCGAGDRPEGRRHQRPVRLGTRSDPLPQVRLSDQAAGGPVPPCQLLHRQLAATTA